MNSYDIRHIDMIHIYKYEFIPVDMNTYVCIGYNSDTEIWIHINLWIHMSVLNSYVRRTILMSDELYMYVYLISHQIILM